MLIIKLLTLHHISDQQKHNEPWQSPGIKVDLAATEGKEVDGGYADPGHSSREETAQNFRVQDQP